MISKTRSQDREVIFQLIQNLKRKSNGEQFLDALIICSAKFPKGSNIQIFSSTNYEDGQMHFVNGISIISLVDSNDTSWRTL